MNVVRTQLAHRRYATVLVAALALAVGLLVAGPPPGAYAADNGRWSVYPADQAGRDGKKAAKGTAHRTYFRMKADPGRTVRDKVTVSNLAKEPVTFLLYAADAYNTPRDGGFAVREPTEKQRSVGVWTRLARSEVTVAAGGKATVPFTVAIPRTASPGDHPGAVVALDKRVARAQGTGVGIRQAVGARLYLQVNGERKPGLSVRDVRFDYAVPLLPGLGKDATITYTLVNSGNVQLEPRVDLKAKGLFGRTSFDSPGSRLPAELMPGQRVRITQKWAAPPPLDWGSLELTASDEGGELVESGSTAYRTVNWGVLVTPALVVLLVIVAVVVRRRRVRSAARS
ncbi:MULTISPECIES: COG1470 family protein [Streptomyces]